jgi:hypothetical protein
MDQQRWQNPASPAPTAPAPPANLDHGSRDAEAWAATPWAVVTATGIVQARCGQPTPAGACGAWRLSAPGGERWKPCYGCSSVEAPVAVQAAGPDVAAAVAQASQAGCGAAPMTVSHYAEAFHPAEGRCFRFVSVAGTHGQPTHCPAPPAWRGLDVAGNGRGYRVEACDGHRGSLTQAQRLPPP